MAAMVHGRVGHDGGGRHAGFAGVDSFFARHFFHHRVERDISVAILAARGITHQRHRTTAVGPVVLGGAGRRSRWAMSAKSVVWLDAGELYPLYAPALIFSRPDSTQSAIVLTRYSSPGPVSLLFAACGIQNMLETVATRDALRPVIQNWPPPVGGGNGFAARCRNVMSRQTISPATGPINKVTRRLTGDIRFTAT